MAPVFSDLFFLLARFAGVAAGLSFFFTTFFFTALFLTAFFFADLFAIFNSFRNVLISLQSSYPCGKVSSFARTKLAVTLHLKLSAFSGQRQDALGGHSHIRLHDR